MRVAIIGMGFVGLSLAVVLASKNVKVIGIEHDQKKLELLKKGISPFYEPEMNLMLKTSLQNQKLSFLKTIDKIFDTVDLIFVTVGTPLKNNHIDLGAIKYVSKKIGQLLNKYKNPIIIFKSTIPPGTTENILIPLLENESNLKFSKDFSVIYNPEFLREGKAIYDQKNPHILVIGSSNQKVKNTLLDFFSKIYSKTVPRINVNFTTSEMIKFSNNAFLATKLSFINTISNLCQKIPNTDVDVIAKCIGLDPRIGADYLKAGPGYGGSCLPKDLDSLIFVCKKTGFNPILFKSVKQVNELQLKQILSILKKKMNNLKNKRISILGLSFKEDSDDIRESVSIKLIRLLLKEKCIVNVHDPKALQNTEQIFKDKISYHYKILECLRDSDCAIILTPWKQYVKLKPNDFKVMNTPLLIDTRRILKHLDSYVDYHAMGISKNLNQS